MSRSPFDALVDDYDAARPGYPPELYDVLETSLRRPLSGQRVLELGAGTGKATRDLVHHGADVVALDLGPAMLHRLRTHLPGIATVVADAEALPLADDSVDLVCAAQAWHWFHGEPACHEVARVLRSGGALAVWWNEDDAAANPWWEAQVTRIERYNQGFTRGYRDRDWVADLQPLGAVTSATVRWRRDLELDDFMRWMASKSYVAAIGEALPAFLSEERAALLGRYPDGSIPEQFDCALFVVRPT